MVRFPVSIKVLIYLCQCLDWETEFFGISVGMWVWLLVLSFKKIGKTKPLKTDYKGIQKCFSVFESCWKVFCSDKEHKYEFTLDLKAILFYESWT